MSPPTQSFAWRGPASPPPLAAMAGPTANGRVSSKAHTEDLDVGRYVQGGNIYDQGPDVHRRVPSSKVHMIAGDIAQLERRAEWLESRNGWLTKQLLNHQRMFIERSLLSNVITMMTTVFQAWMDACREARLEAHLSQQTRSLDKCQAVAKELGIALGQEQAARMDCERFLKEAQDELQAALETEASLKRQYHEGQLQLEVLERRCQECEASFRKSRAEAQAVIDHHDRYEKRKKELEEEDRQARAPDPLHPIEQSIKLRQEAHGVMQRVTSLLGPRGVSPEREP